MSSNTSILPVIAAVWLMLAAPGFASIAVVTPRKASPLEKQVARELVSSLQKIYPNDKFSVEQQLPSSGKAIWIGLAKDEAIARRIRNEKPPGPEGYVVTTANNGELELGIIAGADVRGVAYGVYALLRKLGCGFYISYDALPAAKPGPFSFDGWQLTDQPLVQDRLVFNWHNFLSGCSTWNLPDWKSWIWQSQKQGYNAVMVHAYGNNPMASFTFNACDFTPADARLDDYYRELVKAMDGPEGLILASYIAPAISLDKGKYDAANRDRNALARQVFELMGRNQ